MLVFYFFNFLLWNNVGYVMLSVYKLVLAPSDLLACGLFRGRKEPSPGRDNNRAVSKLSVLKPPELHFLTVVSS